MKQRSPLWHRLKDILWYAETLALEFFFSGLKLLWGAFLLAPFRAFNSSWIVLERFTPETIMGIWLVFIGSVQLAGVLTQNRAVRIMAVALASPSWLLIGLSLFAFSWRSPGWLLFTWLSLINLWIYLRLQRKAAS